MTTKGMNKVGRKPKGWKSPYSTKLQVKKGTVTIYFDEEDIKGDLKDFMMKTKPVEEDQQEDQQED